MASPAAALVALALLLVPSIIEAAIFICLILLSRRIKVGEDARRLSLIGLWTIGAAAARYAIFQGSQGLAIVPYQRTLSIPLLSVILWFQAVVIAPSLALTFLRWLPDRH